MNARTAKDLVGRVLRATGLLAIVAGAVPAQSGDWTLDDVDEIGCNNVICTFCRTDTCDTCDPDRADPECDCPYGGDTRDCLVMVASSAEECEELLADLNASGLGGGVVTPAREYVHAITDWTSLPSASTGADCATCGRPLATPRTRPFVLELVRTFRSRLFQPGTAFGRRWQHNYDYELRIEEGPTHREAIVSLPGSTKLHFVDKDKLGVFVPWNTTISTGATFSADGPAWMLATREGHRFHFVATTDDAAVPYRPDWIEDRTGYRLTFTYDGVADGVDRLVSVGDSFGRTLTWEWGKLWGVWPVVTRVLLPDGRAVVYSHTTLDDYTVTHPGGDVSTYVHGDDVLGEFFAFHDAKGRLGSRKHRVYVTGSGQVRGVADVAGSLLFVPRNDVPNEIAFEYSTGRRETLRYDDDGLPVELVQDDTGAARSWTWNKTLGLVLSATDAQGGVTTYAYASGQLVAKTLPDGSRRSWTWSGGHVASSTDENGATTYHAYDASGNRIRTDRPDGSSESWTWGPYGLMASHTDGGGHVTTYEWDAWGQPARMIAPDDDAIVGNEPVTTWVHDATGRLLESTDPLGRTTRRTWDDADRVTRIEHPDGTTNEFVFGTNGTDPVDLAGTTGLVVAEKDRCGRWRTSTYDALDDLLELDDELGVLERRTYVPATRLLASRERDGTLETFEYDARGRMAARHVAADALTTLTWTWEYDVFDAVVRTVDPHGFSTVVVRDPRGRIVSSAAEVAPGSFLTTLSSWDAAGNLVRSTDPAGHVTLWQYDGLGRVVAETDATGAVTAFTWDADGRLVATVDALGNLTSREYTARGMLAREIDPLGASTRSTYDLADQLVAIDDAAGGRRTFEWGCCGRLLEERTFVDGGANDIVIERQYDGEGRPVGITDGEGFTWTIARDARGRPVLATDPLGSPTQTTWFDDGSAFDPRLATGQGQAVRTVDALGGATLVVLDGAQRRFSVVDPNGATTRWTYDEPAGDLVAHAVTDANGHTRTVRADGLGRVVESEDALGFVTLTGYDAAGNAVSTTDARGGTTQRSFDAVGRLVCEEFADGASVAWAWGPTGLLVGRTDPDGRQLVLEHDAAGNLVAIVGHDGVQADVFEHDAVGRLVRATSGLSPGGGTLLRAWDPAGRLVAEDQSGLVVSYAYDRRSLPVAVVTPGGRVFTRTYTPLGALDAVSDASTTWLDHVDDALGRPIGIARGNGTSTQREYDPAGRVVGIRHLAGADEIDRIAYVRDAVGNPLAALDATFPARTAWMVYDADDRLTSWTLGDPLAHRSAWSLDGVGNWSSLTRDGVTQRRVHDERNRLVAVSAPTVSVQLPPDAAQVAPAKVPLGGPKPSAPPAVSVGTPPADGTRHGWAPLRWDVVGRLVADGVRAFEYDDLGRLERVRLAATGDVLGEYAYDALGRRVLHADLVSGLATRAVHDGERVLEERDGAGDLLATYVHGRGIDEVAVRIGASSAAYYHLDARHDTLALTDDAGAVVERCEVAPYGECTTYAPDWTTPLPASRIGNPYIFAGRELDAESGLVFVRARSYAPEFGRFVQPDPMGIATHPNPYEYADGNPFTRSDPTGLDAWITIKCPSADATCDPWIPYGRVGSVVFFSVIWTRECWGNCTVTAKICLRTPPATTCGPWHRSYHGTQRKVSLWAFGAPSSTPLGFTEILYRSGLGSCSAVADWLDDFEVGSLVGGAGGL